MMREIVERLTETRQIERAKSILESNGYNVSKETETKRVPRRLKESYSWSGWGKGTNSFMSYSNEYFSDDSHEYGVVYSPDSSEMEEDGYGAEINSPDGNPVKVSPVFDTEQEAKDWVESYFGVSKGSKSRVAKPKKMPKKVGGVSFSSEVVKKKKSAHYGNGTVLVMSDDYTEDKFIADMKAAGCSSEDEGWYNDDTDYYFEYSTEGGHPVIYYET